MKTLKKIHLKSVSESLSDKEMKLVVGGGSGSGSGSSSSNKCIGCTDSLGTKDCKCYSSSTDAENHAGKDGWWCCNCDDAKSKC